MGRALALLLTLVLGMFARPAQGGVAYAQDHSLEAAEPGDDVANHERRPTAIQRFERPRPGGEPDTSWIDSEALVHPAQRWEPSAAVQKSTVVDTDVVEPRSAWRTQARSRGPPAARR